MDLHQLRLINHQTYLALKDNRKQWETLKCSPVHCQLTTLKCSKKDHTKEQKKIKKNLHRDIKKDTSDEEKTREEKRENREEKRSQTKDLQFQFQFHKCM